VKVEIQNIDGELKVDGSLPQNQQSLKEQLIELDGVAVAIGCYDAHDFLIEKIVKIEKIEKIEKIVKKEITPKEPFCCKCSNKIIQLDIDEEYNYMAGCKLISKKNWEKLGNKACPLIKKT